MHVNDWRIRGKNRPRINLQPLDSWLRWLPYPGGGRMADGAVRVTVLERHCSAMQFLQASIPRREGITVTAVLSPGTVS